MRKHVAIAAAGAVLVLAASGVASSDPGRPDTPVREQNLDADGFIAVHEQGVADTLVTNLPTDADGALRTAIEGGVEISGTVGGTVGIDPSANTVGIDPAANDVSLDPSVQAALDAIQAKLDQLVVDGSGNLRVVTPAGAATTDLPPSRRTGFGFSAGAVSPSGDVRLGGFDDPLLVTGMSFVADRDARVVFSRGSGADVTLVHAVFAKANEPVTADFSHPLEASSVHIICDGGCELSYAFTSL